MPGQSLFQRIAGQIGLYGAVACYVVFALLPIYWTIKISVTPQDLLYSEGIRLWPSRMTLANYASVLKASDFPRYFLNSVIVSVSTAFIVTVVASFAGYALSRFRFRGKALVSLVLLLTQTILLFAEFVLLARELILSRHEIVITRRRAVGARLLHPDLRLLHPDLRLLLSDCRLLRSKFRLLLPELHLRRVERLQAIDRFAVENDVAVPVAHEVREALSITFEQRIHVGTGDAVRHRHSVERQDERLALFRIVTLRSEHQERGEDNERAFHDPLDDGSRRRLALTNDRSGRRSSRMSESARAGMRRRAGRRTCRSSAAPSLLALKRRRRSLPPSNTRE